MFRLFLASVLAAFGLGLALYGTYGDRTLELYFSVLGAIIFIIGLLLLAFSQFRPGTASHSRR